MGLTKAGVFRLDCGEIPVTAGGKDGAGLPAEEEEDASWVCYTTMSSRWWWWCVAVVMFFFFSAEPCPALKYGLSFQ